MAKSKTVSKKTETQKTDEGRVEARPQHQGKDPLAEGNTLANPSNTEAETHYEVKERSEDVQKQTSTINGQNANERAEVHNAHQAPPHSTPNSDAEEQDEVAAGRVEPDGNVDDTPEEVEVPERTEEQEQADSDERVKALDTASKTTDKR